MFQIVRVEADGRHEILTQYKPATQELADDICKCCRVLDETAEFKAEVVGQ